MRKPIYLLAAAAVLAAACARTDRVTGPDRSPPRHAAEVTDTTGATIQSDTTHRNEGGGGFLGSGG